MDKILPPRAVADYLGVNVNTLANWRWRGEGPPYIRINGGTIRYRVSDLVRWLDTNTISEGGAA